jgi:hypothetical protein
MESQKSIILPMVLSVLLSAIIFGGLGYYLANSLNATNTTQSTTITSTATPTTVATAASSTSITGETADWKTYTATKYGFSFKYANEWDLRATRYPIEIELDATNIQTNHKSIYLESSTDTTRITEIEKGRAGASSDVAGLTWKSYTYTENNPGELGDNRTTLAAVTKQGGKTYIVRFAYNQAKNITDTDVQTFLSGFKVIQ